MTEQRTGELFIIYRRSDCATDAQRIHQYLCQELRHEKVSLNADDIPSGNSIRDPLQERMTRCKILLVVIGRNWTTAVDEADHQLLSRENDPVHLQLNIALESGIPVLPLLIDDASMPSPRDLPPELEALCRQHPMRLAGDGFQADLARLVKALRASFDVDGTSAETGHAQHEDFAHAKPSRAIPSQMPSKPQARPPLLAIAMAALLAAGLVALGTRSANESKDDERAFVGATSQVTVVPAMEPLVTSAPMTPGLSAPRLDADERARAVRLGKLHQVCVDRACPDVDGKLASCETRERCAGLGKLIAHVMHFGTQGPLALPEPCRTGPTTAVCSRAVAALLDESAESEDRGFAALANTCSKDPAGCQLLGKLFARR